MKNYTDISIASLGYIFLFYLLIAMFSYIKNFKFTKDLIIGSIRATIQLSFIGYILSFIFTKNNPYLTLLALTIMITAASIDAYYRQKEHKMSFLPFLFLTAISQSYIIIMGFLILFVLKLNPWYNPRYILPISGMIIGNIMNSLSVAINSFNSSLINNILRIETEISLGASPYEAVSDLFNKSLHQSMIPKINSLMVTGLVSLPGMMSGQIIGGISPFSAVRYQLMILLAIVGSAFLGTYFGLYLNFKHFFDKFWRLKEEIYWINR